MALALVVILVVAAVVVLAFTLPGGKKTAASTSTSAKLAPSSSTTSTSLGTAATTSTVTSLASGTQTYSALLSGQNETPALSTSASGTLTLTVGTAGSSVNYVLRVSKITDLTVARLHEGKAGATGATILTLYGGPTRGGLFSGVLTQGSFTAPQLEGPLKGKTIADFVALVEAGSLYLNVGTSSHPLGEIRGQLK